MRFVYVRFGARGTGKQAAVLTMKRSFPYVRKLRANSGRLTKEIRVFQSEILDGTPTAIEQGKILFALQQEVGVQ